MEDWRRVWREGVVPLLSKGNLEVLRHALQSNDCRVLQGRTTSPPPLYGPDGRVQGACPVGYIGAMELGGFEYDYAADRTMIPLQREAAATVGEVDEWFARFCSAVDSLIDELAGCRWLLNWIDETPRAEMIASLLPEVERAIRSKTEETS